ncbi:MAG: alpha/beta fold hydrolase [Opitutaceae bacterium]|nr:alpha/beta fold hydrolase [Opitutaceae bacterium]
MASPLVVIHAPTSDGQRATAIVRSPPGKGPYPAIIFLHGGFQKLTLDTLRKDVLLQPTLTQARFLAAGYVTMAATFRSRRDDPQTRDALIDCLAIIDYVKKRPEVDPKNVVVFGASGGGSLALELAGAADVCAVAAGEPATLFYTGMLTKERKDLKELRNHKRYYTPDLRKFTEAKIDRIKRPILIVRSDVHDVNQLNNEDVIPAIKAAGKSIETILYPGHGHGFYNGYNLEVGETVFRDLARFFSRHLSTQPTPIDRKLIKLEPIVHPGPRVERARDPALDTTREPVRSEKKNP